MTQRRPPDRDIASASEPSGPPPQTMSRQEEQRGSRALFMPFMIAAAVIFAGMIVWSLFMP